MTAVGYAAVGLILLLAAISIIGSRWKLRRMMGRMDQMLAAAMDGTFSEEVFDESHLSALESRLAQYLTASTVSARNLQTQKDQISALIADISHQTRTPVTNLQLYAQLLEEQPLSPQGHSCAQALSTQAEKLQALIEALVKTSRLETGILALHPEPGDLAPVVERATAQYAPKAAEKRITLTAEQTAGTAAFDPKWTEEAVCNLLDNAVKYTPAGGSVTIAVQTYTFFSVIRVSDTGPGIPEPEQARIFSRFYRSPSAWQQEGVGIGLYLTRQIAETQGGYVKVASAPGKGSVFSLYLPRQGEDCAL